MLIISIIRIKDFHELVIYRFEFPAFYLPNGWQFAPTVIGFIYSTKRQICNGQETVTVN